MTAPQPAHGLFPAPRAGDPGAAAAVFGRFAGRLVALARRRLGREVRRKEDPEDVIQSVFRSFFTRWQDGRLDPDSWESLWGLLTAITLRKCHNRVVYYRADRRDLRREVPLPGEDSAWLPWEVLTRDPTPEEATVLADTLEQLMRGLEPRERTILSLHLQGYSHAEIAGQVGRAERTVRRVVELARKRLRRLRAGTEED